MEIQNRNPFVFVLCVKIILNKLRFSTSIFFILYDLILDIIDMNLNMEKEMRRENLESKVTTKLSK